MPYAITHHFDPDFDHRHLKPRQLSDGSVDHHDLGYVQNVVSGQVLAEIGEARADHDPRFLLDEPVLPAGPGTAPDPDDPRRLLATVNGFVHCDDQGRIEVREVLNVRRDVDYNTGNVAFVGELAVHGAVRSGFRLRAAGVRVEGTVEAARITSTRGIVCASGIKGGGEALLQAVGPMEAAFCENATLVCRDAVTIRGPAMHSHIYSRGPLTVEDRFTGGSLHCLDRAVVHGRLGGGIGARTAVVGGYDPLFLFADQKVNQRVRQLRRQTEQLKARSAKGPAHAREIAQSLDAARTSLAAAMERKALLWERIAATEVLHGCRIEALGEVRPGVEICIGPAYLRVDEEMENVVFTFADNEIRIEDPGKHK